MTAVRIVLGLAGLWLAWIGIDLLLGQSRIDLISAGLWFVGAIVLHDGVFAPLCAALGVGGKRLLPPTSAAPVAVGTVCTVTLVLISVPVLGRELAVAANPTVLDRDYPAGLLAAVVVVWVLVGIGTVGWRAATRRRG
ncbi:hypothetical protein [Nocardia rhizosphaerae]|uniref:Uncharacterized protein n=1 Tax=Nocardia rhizosphaerae TaxID=1691571 RepID=A0ABV8LA28_9NOCA